MLAARDQENRLFGHSVGGAAGKNHALGPKTPGAKYPNTPMKVPLNDGNATTRLAGGKSVLGGRPHGGNENLRTAGKAGKSNLVTPLEPRTARAPLGNKTTNAKAHALQQAHHNQQQKSRAGGGGGVKDIVREIEQSQQQQPAPQTGTRRPKAATPRVNNPFKLSVLSDASKMANRGAGGEEEDIEYAPPRIPARPYESDVFPDGVLTFAAFQPQNRLRGVYDHYYNPVDEDGVPLREKEFAEQQRRAFEKLDIRVQEDLDAFDWSIGDVPASKDYFANKRKQQQQQQQKQQQQTTIPGPAPPPATIASRNAASALALAPKPNKPTAAGTVMRRKAPVPTAANASSASSSLLSGLPLRKQRTTTSTLPLRPKSINHPVAETASRTTLGYNKGRTALSLVRGNGAPRAPSSTLRSTAGSGSSSAAAPAAVAAGSRRTGPATETDNGGAALATTPAPRALQKQTSLGDMYGESQAGPAAPRSPAFLSIFEVEDGQDNLGGAGTFVNDDLDDGFQMDIKF